MSVDVIAEIRSKLLLLLSGKLGSGPNWFGERLLSVEQYREARADAERATSYCTAAAEQALNSLFLLDLGAPQLCTELLHAWANRLFAAVPTTDDERDSGGNERCEEGGGQIGESEAPSEAPSEALSEAPGADADAAVHCSASQLSQFFFLIGHISIRMLVYTEKLESVWKRLRQAQKDERAAPSRSLDSCANSSLSLLQRLSNSRCRRRRSSVA